VAAIAKPIRIARIITRFGVGGVERHVSTLTANLDREKFQSWVICGRAGKNERECLDFATNSGVKPILIGNLRRDLGIWDVNASFKLHRALARIRPQIVETHQSKAGALGRSMARLNFKANGQRPRLIHTFHCHQFEGYFSSPATRAFVAIERVLARFTDMIITVTPSIRRTLIEKYQIANPSKIRVVPLGFNFEWLQDIPMRRGWLRARLGVDDSTVIFGFVGRLTMIKNVEMLLRAFARMLRNTAMSARLVIVGDGELRGALQSLAYQLEIADRVMFCGWILDRAAIYCDLDVTCLSSFNEGSPVCLIESLAAGIPVVATEVGGVADIVTNQYHGELVTSGDEEAYAAALARRAKRLGNIPGESGESVRESFSITRLIADIESIYLEVLSRDSSPEAIQPVAQQQLS
jgi:glycosyltransferase involved in cell wall biosynthesis